jgi:hypothetical protein
MSALTYFLNEFKYWLCGRTGQLAVLSIFVLTFVAVQFFSDWEKSPVKQAAAGEASQEVSWLEEQGKVVAKTNENFHSLEFDEPDAVVVSVPPAKAIIPTIETKPKTSKLGDEKFEPLAPLNMVDHPIVEQVSRSVVTKEPGKIVQLPQGALLHCQLLQPISSVHLGMVQVRLTRAVVIHGQTQLRQGTILVGNLKEFRAGRFFFEQNWKGRNGEGAEISLTAVSQQNDYNVSMRRFGRADGQLGIPGRPIKLVVKSKGGQELLANILRASGELAKDRAHSALGEYVPYNARNILLKGATDSFESHLARLKEPDENDEKEFVLVTGTDFYLFTVESENDVAPHTEQRLSTDSLRELIRQSK